MVTGNTYERSQCEIQRVFVGAAVDKRNAVALSVGNRKRARSRGTFKFFKMGTI